MVTTVVSAVMLLSAWFTSGERPLPRCPAVTAEQLLALAPQNNTPVRVVFFSTWCSACAEHLHTVEGMPTWAVGAFDTAERIEQGLNFRGFDVPCYMASDDLLDTLKIRRVPSVWRLSRAVGLEKL